MSRSLPYSVTHQLFMDDLKLYAVTDERLKEALEEVVEVRDGAGPPKMFHRAHEGGKGRAWTLPSVDTAALQIMSP